MSSVSSSLHRIDEQQGTRYGLPELYNSLSAASVHITPSGDRLVTIFGQSQGMQLDDVLDLLCRSLLFSEKADRDSHAYKCVTRVRELCEQSLRQREATFSLKNIYHSIRKISQNGKKKELAAKIDTVCYSPIGQILSDNTVRALQNLKEYI